MTKTRGEMPLLEHLEELRWRILWSILAIAVCSSIGVCAVIRLDVMNLPIGPLYTVIVEIA